MLTGRCRVHPDLLPEIKSTRVSKFSASLVQPCGYRGSDGFLEFADNLFVVGDPFTGCWLGLPGSHILDDVGEHPDLLLKVDAVAH